MAKPRKERLYEKIETALKEMSKREALYRAMKRGRDNRAAAIEGLPGGDAFRKRAREIKDRCLDRQDELLEGFAGHVRSRGSKVYLAEDGMAAIEYILEVCRRCGAETVAKSKSLTSEEIEVNHPIEEAGMEVIETDLGELILQKVGEKPFHLVFPAVHKTAAEVADSAAADSSGGQQPSSGGP